MRPRKTGPKVKPNPYQKIRATDPVPSGSDNIPTYQYHQPIPIPADPYSGSGGDFGGGGASASYDSGGGGSDSGGGGSGGGE